jgi:hypothetical protein
MVFVSAFIFYKACNFDKSIIHAILGFFFTFIADYDANFAHLDSPPLKPFTTAHTHHTTAAKIHIAINPVTATISNPVFIVLSSTQFVLSSLQFYFLPAR